MTPDLRYLAWAAALTGLLWVPYVLDRFVAWGIPDTVGYPAQPKPQSPWAERLMKAHRNAVENLVVFAALVLVAHAGGVGPAAVEGAALLYFWSRVVHAAAYTFAVPWLRTLGFLGGFAAQAIVAWQILAR
jgi:uncharacterized MAPEG superfamily protein